MTHSASFFGTDANQYLAMIDGLRLAQLKTRYAFMADDEYDRLLREDLGRANQVYWSEILVRAHWCAITAILRHRRWVSAVSSAVRDKNALAFAAALRGLIESIADAHTAFQHVPTTLAMNWMSIRDAILGKIVEAPLIVDQLEDDLIHFTHASKLRKGEIAPKAHRAGTIQDYMDILVRAVPKISECYGKLCDYTHPGLSSVWLWVRPLGEREFELESDQDVEVISSLRSEYGSIFLPLLMFGFNGPIMTLAVLNYFPAEFLHTPALRTWDLSDIPAWQKMASYLPARSPRTAE